MLAVHVAAAGLAASQPVDAPVMPPSPPLPAPAEPAASADGLPVPEFGAVPAEPGTPPPGQPSQGGDDPLLDDIKLADDPLEGFNRVSFGISWAIDKVLIRPVALTYRHVVPRPARDGARNALSNIGEPLVFANDLLQLRPRRAFKTLGRFLINSTVGLGGLFDLAKRKPFYLPHHQNSLGSTLAYYGVGPGPYIYIPILGPTTLRDAVDNAEGVVWPGVTGHPLNTTEYDIAATAVDGIDQRERTDDEIEAMFGDSVDRYASFRANFLQDREGEIAVLKAKDGEEPKSPELEDPLADPAAAPPAK